MSIKLYNGCKLNCTNKYIMQVLKEIKSNMRQFLLPQAQQELTALLAELSCSLSLYTLSKTSIRTIIKTHMPEYTTEQEVDTACGYLQKSINAFATYMTKTWFQSYLKEPQIDIQYEGFNAQFKLFIIPMRNDTYCIPIGSPKAIQHFNTLPYISEYEYYDNSDKPEHISKQAWQARYQKWKSLLPSGDLTEDALSYDIVQPNNEFLYHMRPDSQSITTYLQKNHLRIAELHTIARVQNQMELELPQTLEENSKNYYALMQKLRDGDIKLTAQRENVMTKLPTTWEQCIDILKQAQQILND